MISTLTLLTSKLQRRPRRSHTSPRSRMTRTSWRSFGHTEDFYRLSRYFYARVTLHIASHCYREDGAATRRHELEAAKLFNPLA